LLNEFPKQMGQGGKITVLLLNTTCSPQSLHI
jgi:hypothetical protein